MNQCCSSKVEILCTVCKTSACVQHKMPFMVRHRPADKLTEAGREVFDCGDNEVSYFIEDGTIVLCDPNELIKNYMRGNKVPKTDCPICFCPWSMHDKVYGCSMADAGGGSCGCQEKKPK